MKKAIVALLVVAVAIGWWLTRDTESGAMAPPQVVNVIAPRDAQLANVIEAVGTAEARASVNVVSEVDGRLVEVLFREGQQVDAGALLARLDDRQARAALARAEAERMDAEAAWKRARQLQSSQVLSEAEADTLKAALKAAQANHDAASADLADHQIRASFAGVIGLRRVNEGAYVKAGDIITTLDDLQQLQVIFSVPEKYLGQLATGQKVDVTSASYGNKRFTGELSRIDTRVDAVNRTVAVKADIDNSEGLLRPGQFLQLYLRTGERNALMIPEQAVLTEGAVSFAYTVKDGVAQRIEVKTGSRARGWVEILAGIDAADQVVINGHARLGTGSRVEVQDDPDALLPQTAAAFLPDADNGKAAEHDIPASN
ncbi:MAG: efflux RND transporter periplasmic adaptor subunit [Alcanivoracaceae bacterium]|nr:efflux RND transporter periplasmic adaptor subunit [Alcanivoracaceae bacterium]